MKVLIVSVMDRETSETFTLLFVSFQVCQKFSDFHKPKSVCCLQISTKTSK